MRYGLTESCVAKILKVAESFVEIETLVLYGSRALGTYKNGSDIDLVMLGEKLDSAVLGKFSLALDDLLLPYTFDLALFSQIENQELRKHIERVGQTLYKRLPVSVK